MADTTDINVIIKKYDGTRWNRFNPATTIGQVTNLTTTLAKKLEGVKVTSNDKLANGFVEDVVASDTGIHVTYTTLETLGLGTIYVYQGSKDTYEDIAGITSAKKGDVWNCKSDSNVPKEGGGTEFYPAGTNFAWTGATWDALGGSLDLSAYQKKLIAGTNIQIDENTNQISATDTTYGEADKDTLGLVKVDDSWVSQSKNPIQSKVVWTWLNTKLDKKAPSVEGPFSLMTHTEEGILAQEKDPTPEDPNRIIPYFRKGNLVFSGTETEATGAKAGDIGFFTD